MHSVIIVSTANLYYGNSAAVARMNNYARALAQANVDVYLVCVYSFQSQEEMVEVEPHIYACSHKKVRVRHRYDVFFIYSVIKKIRKFIHWHHGHVTILNYSSANLLLDIALLLFVRGIHIYCEVNEVRKFESSGQSIRVRMNNKLLEKTYKRYDGLVFISRTIQEYYRPVARKSIVVPILSECNKPFSVSKGIDTLNAVFVGSIYFPKENLEELLEGFCSFASEHPNARLNMYGILTRSDKEKLDDFIDKSHMRGIINYCGVIQHSDVEEVLSSAGVLLLSRANNKQNYYGFSTKLSEYAVSGTPIIMTNTGVVTDYFRDRVNCLMCNGYDRNSFKEKFEEWAIMDIEEKKNIAKQAYLTAQQNFDYRLYSEKLADFLS